jgi:hypothetical protein
MALVNATDPRPNTRLSESMTKANNQGFNFSLQDYLYSRKPDFWVYIYNISNESYNVFRPPLFANFHIIGLSSTDAQGNLVKHLVAQDGTKYVLSGRLPSPLLAPMGNVDSNEVSTTLMDTRRVVQDICNPDNLSLDQNMVIQNPTNVGNDLNKKGVFWSLRGPGSGPNGEDELPTQREITDAKNRLERHYNSILEKMKALEASNPKELNEQVGPEAHAAADYFDVETTWHTKRSQPMDCPVCGSRVRKGVAFHKTIEDTLCVIDWERTTKAGVRTRAQAYEATGDEKFAPRPAPVQEKTPVVAQRPAVDTE